MKLWLMKVQLLVFAENGARVVLVHEGMYLVKDGLDSWVFDLRTSCLYNPVVGKEAEKVT